MSCFYSESFTVITLTESFPGAQLMMVVVAVVARELLPRAQLVAEAVVFAAELELALQERLPWNDTQRYTGDNSRNLQGARRAAASSSTCGSHDRNHRKRVIDPTK